MMAVCDSCIGVDGPKFGLTETRLGLIPATISPYVVARIGGAAARRHFLSARLFDAAEAHRIGLLSRVVAPEDLDAAVEAEIVPFLACAPGAVAASKALVALLAPPPDRAMVAATIGLLVDRWKAPRPPRESRPSLISASRAGLSDRRRSPRESMGLSRRDAQCRIAAIFLCAMVCSQQIAVPQRLFRSGFG